MSEKYYEIKSGVYTFHAIVFKEDEMYRIRFGGKKACVSFTVYKGDKNPNLDSLSYDQSRCVAKGSMAKVAMAFLYKLFPKLGDVYLCDWSDITCNNDVRVVLYQYYLVKYCKTWYQQKFGAVPVDSDSNEDSKVIAKFIKHIKDPASKLSYEDFTKRYIESYFRPQHKERLKSLLRPHYENARTYHEFFKDVSGEFDCMIFHKWLNAFFKRHCHALFQEMFWRIPKENIEYPDVSVRKLEIKPELPSFIQEGGGYMEQHIPREAVHL